MVLPIDFGVRASRIGHPRIRESNSRYDLSGERDGFIEPKGYKGVYSTSYTPVSMPKSSRKASIDKSMVAPFPLGYPPQPGQLSTTVTSMGVDPGLLLRILITLPQVGGPAATAF